MGILSKSDYERRMRNVDRRNTENADILEEQGFETDQIRALEDLCSIRHELHTFGAETLWNVECGSHDRFRDWLNGGIQEMLEDAGFDNDLLFDTDDLPASNDDEFMDIDDFDVYYEESIEVLSDFIDDVNRKIEKWLRKFDKQYGTHYAPTGLQRI